MSTTMPQSAPMTAEDYEATFYRIMAEAESLNEQMRHDRVEIEKLKAETTEIRDETRAILASIGAKV
jgi:uncharacterized protein YdcH (DUF465 family)